MRGRGARLTKPGRSNKSNPKSQKKISGALMQFLQQTRGTESDEGMF